MRRSSPRRRGRGSVWAGARVALVVVATTILLVGVAFTAANLVPPTNVDDVTTTDLPSISSPPPECDGFATANTISGTGLITGTMEKDWIIGSEAADTIEGLDGNDCIEGRGEGDIIDGGPGEDVCIGGDGADVFLGCETEVQ